MSTEIADRQDLTPRLTPIETPDSLRMKLAYWLSRKTMGKVLTPLKVLYARFPESFGFVKALNNIEGKFTIDHELKNLIRTYVASMNGCAFCVDIAKADLKKEGDFSAKLDHLMRYRESDRFSDAEKAALAYAEEATLNKHVSDETFERLQQQFDENEIVQITMINAIENLYNLMNKPMNIGSDELCDLWHAEER